jgi:hypothetical protein
MDIPLTDEDLRDWAARDDAWPSATMAKELLALRAVLDQIDDLAFEILAGEGETKRQAQDKLGDLLAARIDDQLRDVLSVKAQPDPESNLRKEQHEPIGRGLQR